jgi:DNA-binding MarR family transcriptional regulator
MIIFDTIDNGDTSMVDQNKVFSPAAPPVSDPGDEAWRVMMQIFRSQKRHMAKLASEFDLAPAQIQLLMHLDHSRSMSELAEALACDASYVTGVVDKLEAKRVAHRIPSTSDRRVRIIALTESGAALRAALIAKLSEAPPFIAALPKADKQALRDIFLRAAEIAGVTPMPDRW